MHAFDEAMTLERVGAGCQRGTTSPAYGNFNGQFGGATAALLLKAVMNQEGVAGALVSLTANFTAAVKQGPFEITTRAVRTGRTLQHWATEMMQGDTVVASGLVTFGQRVSAWEHAPLKAPAAPAPETLKRFDTGTTPGWTGQYDMRFVQGSIEALRGKPPLETPGDARSLVWLRHIGRPLDFPALACMSDAFLVRLIQVRNTFPPMGTVSLTTQFHVDDATLAANGDASVLCDVNSRVFRANFHDQTAEMWSEGGKLLATSHQMVWYAE